MSAENDVQLLIIKGVMSDMDDVEKKVATTVKDDLWRVYKEQRAKNRGCAAIGLALFMAEASEDMEKGE